MKSDVIEIGLPKIFVWHLASVEFLANSPSDKTIWMKLFALNIRQYHFLFPAFRYIISCYWISCECILNYKYRFPDGISFPSSKKQRPKKRINKYTDQILIGIMKTTGNSSVRQNHCHQTNAFFFLLTMYRINCIMKMTVDDDKRKTKN